MIYIDTSVVLASLFAEGRRPPEKIWTEPLVSSRLLQYEAWNRVNAMGVSKSDTELLQKCLERIGFVEMSQVALERALRPFPIPVRTLDSLHLATLEFLRTQGHSVSLATYDSRMIEVAKKLRIALFAL